MKRIKKKLVAVVLAVNMLVIGIFGSYQTAQAAEIVAGYTALEVIEGILLSFGISIFTTEMVSTLTEDPTTAQDEYWRETQAAHWAEYMEAVYEEERKKGGGGSGPTPTPGVTGSDIPSFKEVIQNMKNTGKIVLGAAAGAGVWECMSKAVSSLWNKMMGTTKSELENNAGFTQAVANNWDSLSYPYYVYIVVRISTGKRFCFNLFPNGTFWYKNSNGKYVINWPSNTSMKYLETRTDEPESYVYKGSSPNFSEFKNDMVTNVPFFEDVSAGLAWRENQLSNAGKYKKENIWVHPDLQDTYKNNGKLEYPQQAPQPLQVPSIAQLTDLANKLKTNPQQSPNSVQELIDQLKQNPQPQPTVAPNPDPNPNPEVTPKPDDTTTDVNPDDYKADLRLVFPFCIPFDLVHLIQAFEAEPEAPVFEFPFDLELENPWTGKKILDYHHVFKLDMSDYEPVIKIFRIFEIIFFIIGLLMITRQQMIKG